MISGFFVIAWGLGAAGGVNFTHGPAQSIVPPNNAPAKPVIVIQAYNDGLSGVRAVNPAVHLSVGRDSSISDERVLMVEYPAPTDDQAGRDVRCVAESQDWTGARAISFQIKPAHPLRFSLSFLDRNRVAYTAWTDLKGGVWQLVRIPLDERRCSCRWIGTPVLYSPTS